MTTRAITSAMRWPELDPMGAHRMALGRMFDTPCHKTITTEK